MAKKEVKTNVMRILDQAKIPYRAMQISKNTTASTGVEMAADLGEDKTHVYKTLVTIGASGEHFVFAIPVAESLHLKKSAQAVGDKSIEMIKQKDLLPLTGYMHGGCSMIGMKKLFKTVVDSSAESLEKIIFSAGKVGVMIEITVEDLKKVIPVEFADITV